MSEYETTIERHDREIEIIVDFDFEPAEKMTHDYPECDAQVIINEIRTFDGSYHKNGSEVHLTKEQEERLREEIMDWISREDDERWDY